MPNSIVIRLKPAFVDERGDITNVLRSDVPLVHVGCSRTKAGVRRSDHYHPEGTEFLLLEEGAYEQWSKKVPGFNNVITTNISSSEDLAVLINGKQIAHFKKGEYELQQEFNFENGVEKRKITAKSLIITPPGTAHAMLFSKDSLFLWFTPKARGSAEGYADTLPFKEW